MREMGARRGRTDTVLDRESPVPLYYQLAQNMETAIRSGRLSSGSHLENEIELARQLRVSRPTVRRAIALLANLENVYPALADLARKISTHVAH